MVGNGELHTYLTFEITVDASIISDKPLEIIENPDLHIIPSDKLSEVCDPPS